MNNSKMWLVVNPTVGIPLFLGAVAVGSFAVHLAVLSKVTWFNDWLSGQGMNGGAAVTSMLNEGDATIPAQVYFVPDGTSAVLSAATWL